MTEVNAILQATKEQINLAPTGDKNLKASLLGQQYMADWKHLVVAAGRGYKLSFGAITVGDDVTGSPGNATLDLDQPEAFVAVDQGFSLIPMEIDISFAADLDAYDDLARLLLTADITQAVQPGGTFVEAGADLSTASGCSIQNLLSDGPAFPGRAASAITGDINDPVHAYVLAHKLWTITQIIAETTGTPVPEMSYSKEWHYAHVLKGPSTMLLYCAGTVAPAYIGSLTFAAVPSSWFPVS